MFHDELCVCVFLSPFAPLQSFNTLHMMYHEATACHVTGDLVELLSIFLSVLKATRPYLQRKGQGAALLARQPAAPGCCSPSADLCVCSVSPDVKQALIQWQERIDFAHKLLTLLNSYSPPELRNACLGKAALGHGQRTDITCGWRRRRSSNV